MPEADTVLVEPGEEKSFFAKHASNTLGISSPPISHNEQFLQRQATLLNQMEQGIGQMAISML